MNLEPPRTPDDDATDEGVEVEDKLEDRDIFDEDEGGEERPDIEKEFPPKLLPDGVVDPLGDGRRREENAPAALKGCSMDDDGGNWVEGVGR